MYIKENYFQILIIKKELIHITLELSMINSDI